MNMAEAEKRASPICPDVAEGDIGTYDREELIRLLDCRSKKLGDAAYYCLVRNDEYDLVIERLLDGTIHTRLGKVRATNMLHLRGRSLGRSQEAFLALLRDKSFDVVSNALFGLVFLQNRANLPAIKAEAERREVTGGKTHERLLLAIEAMVKGNPFIYSPYFKDAAGVWELDSRRFPNGSAPTIGGRRQGRR